MPATIDFYYDLASPNCYLANRVLSGVLERTGAEVVYKPMLLGGVFKATGNQAPWITFAPVKPKMAYGQVEMARFIRKHQLTDYQFNPHFPLNTLILQRCMVAAERAGNLVEYIRAAESLVWEQGLKMDDPEAFAKGFNDAGLDGSGLLAETQNPDVKSDLIAKTEAAVARGIFGAPTFFIGDEMFFGKDRLIDLEDEILSQANG